MPRLAPITEIKRTLAGAEKRFACRLIARDDRSAVVLWVAPEAMGVHGFDLPAGTISFGHFWTDRPYNVYQWLDPGGRILGYYFNIAGETRIGAEVIDWQDLVVDVLATPDGGLQVLDQDELPADLDGATRARIEAGLSAVLRAPAALMADLEARARALWPIALPDRA